MMVKLLLCGSEREFNAGEFNAGGFLLGIWNSAVNTRIVFCCDFHFEFGNRETKIFINMKLSQF